MCRLSLLVEMRTSGGAVFTRVPRTLPFTLLFLIILLAPSPCASGSPAAPPQITESTHEGCSLLLVEMRRVELLSENHLP